jgi:hypothetical protein
MGGSNSKMLQRQLNGSFQLQNAANSKESGQKSRSNKKYQNGKKSQNSSGPFIILYHFITFSASKVHIGRTKLGERNWWFLIGFIFSI